MRKSFIVVALGLLAALPAAAQNTDIEALAGLQFNFGNPGARSLGMGGAFLGLADDASAAEANPAGLTILRKPEVSIEARNYQEQQVFSTSGTYPEINRTAFSHFSQAAEITFASFVYPIKDFTVGAYYHQPLKNSGSGRDIEIQTNPLTGGVSALLPNYYLPVSGNIRPVSKSECEKIRQSANNFFACLEYRLLPFVSAVDVQERTYGIAGAYKYGPVSFGATVRYQQFKEAALTFRYDPDTFQPTSVVAQATGDLSSAQSDPKIETAITYAAGIKWTVTDKIGVGAVYKKGATFDAPTFIANDQTEGVFVKVAETKFHIPDVYGIGISVNPLPVLIINLDAVHVTYSHLVDDFFSINQAIRDIGNPFKANDVTEIRLGGEYFFPTKIPFALRAGVWRDPAHSVEWAGPANTPETIADAILYPKGEAQTHFSIGAGLSFKKFQVDAAYDRSQHYRVGSLSVVARF